MKKNKTKNRITYGFNNIYKDFSDNKNLFISFLLASTVLSIVFVSWITLVVINLFDGSQRISLIGLLTSWLSNPFTVFITAVIDGFFLFNIYKVRLFLRKDSNIPSDPNYVERAEAKPYGKSDFADDEEKEELFEQSPNIDDIKGDILGFEGEAYKDDNGETAYKVEKIYAKKMNIQGTNNNKLVYGSSGAGKTVAIVKNDMSQAMERGDSLIMTDSKGDLYRETAGIAKQYGYTIRILNLKDLEYSDAWNVIKYLDEKNWMPEKYIDNSVNGMMRLDLEASILSKTIIENVRAEEKRDFWYNNELNCLKAAILLVAISPEYEGKRNMSEVMDIIFDPEHFDSKFIYLPEDHLAKNAYILFAIAKDDVKKAILNGLGTRLQLLRNQVVKQVLSHDEIDLSLPMKKKCIYYVIIDDADTTLNYLAAVFFTQLFQVQLRYSDTLDKEDKAAQIPVVYILDEFANIGAIPDFQKKIAVFRSRKISSTIILQSLAQLKSLYPGGEHNTIINNVPTNILLKAGDLETAEHFVKYCGKMTTKIRNVRYRKSHDDIFELHTEEDITEGYGQRDLIMLDEVMKMHKDDMLVYITGYNPVILHKFLSSKYNPIHMNCHKEYQPRAHKPKWRKMMDEDIKKDIEFLENLRNRNRSASLKIDEPSSDID